MTDHGRDLYTVTQAAERLGVSRVSIWRWVRDGHLPAVRLGARTTRIKRADVERIIEQIQDGEVQPETSAKVFNARLAATSHEPPLQLPELGAHDQIVLFYASDALLLDLAATYISTGLYEGIAGIVVAPRALRQELAQRLRDTGIDLESALSRAVYQELDTQSLRSASLLDADRNAELAAWVIEETLAAATRNGRPARLFAEMSTLIGDDAGGAGHALGAIWKERQQSERISLFSAYCVDSLEVDRVADVLRQACLTRAHVIPAESCSLLPAMHEQLSAIVARQEDVHSLRRQIERSRR